MAHRAFLIATITSTLLLAITVFLLLIATTCNIDPRDRHLSITSHCHVAVVWWGGIVFYNNADYGPYSGSVIQLSGDDGIAYPPIERSGFGYSYGLYYRHLRWLESGDILWTVAMSLVYPLVIFAILPAMWIWLRRRQARRSSTSCSIGCNHEC